MVRGPVFLTGLVQFPFRPVFYELIRRIVADDLDYRHLFAPVWLTDEIANILCENPDGPCASPPPPWLVLCVPILPLLLTYAVY